MICRKTVYHAMATNLRYSTVTEVNDGYTFIQASLELAIDCGNQSAIVDVLSVLNLRRSLWTLDMALLVLPELRLILRSNHNR